MGEPRCPSSAIPRNLEQADLGRSTPPLATLVYTETKMSTHKHSEAGNELRSLSMIRYDQSMNATTQRSKDSHFWHLTPLPAHRQVHTSHTPTSGTSCGQPTRRNNSVVTVLDTVTPDIPLADSRSSPPSFSGACSVPGSQAHRRRCSRGLQIWNLSSEFSQRVRKVAWRRTRLRSCRLGESPPSPASSRPTILE